MSGDWFDYPEGEPEYEFCVGSIKCTSFWGRLKIAFNYLFRQEDFIFQDYLLDRTQVKQMRDNLSVFLKKYK